MTDTPLCAFPRPQKIMVLSPDADFVALFGQAFSPAEVDVTALSRGRGAIEILFNDPPDLLVVDQRLADIPGLDLVSMVKSENVYRQLPVALVMDEEGLVRDVDWCTVEVDELLTRPISAPMLRARVSLTLSRATRSLDANPLTKLPGNTSIIGRIQELIDRREDFALAYVDLDYFKSFNDKYGFSRGDEVLMMTARIIVNTVRSVGGAKAFVGHVGGDDFVFILAVDRVEAACKGVVASFDDIVPHFYDADDRARGYIQSTDREGNRRSFPLMAISIAVVFNRDGRLKHFGEASQTAMTLKKKAKENPKSCYVLDQRQG
jgi:diguanylate cyclase (GGDEF)-like protein